MVWFFVVLVIVVLAGVFVVATGRADGMSDPEPSTPPVVPLDGDGRTPPPGVAASDLFMGADDLRRLKFSLAVRGYRMSEVDEVIARLAAQLDTFAGTDAGSTDTPDPDEKSEPSEQ